MNDKEYLKKFNPSLKRRFIRWIRLLLGIYSPSGILQGDPQDKRIFAKAKGEKMSGECDICGSYDHVELNCPKRHTKKYSQEMRAEFKVCPKCGIWHTSMSCPSTVPDLLESKDFLVQPLQHPISNTSKPVWEMVIEDMKERDNFGRNKYGTPLQINNGRDFLIDAYQEALDLVVYLRGLIEAEKIR